MVTQAAAERRVEVSQSHLPILQGRARLTLVTQPVGGTGGAKTTAQGPLPFMCIRSIFFFFFFFWHSYAIYWVPSTVLRALQVTPNLHSTVMWAVLLSSLIL